MSSIVGDFNTKPKASYFKFKSKFDFTNKVGKSVTEPALVRYNAEKGEEEYVGQEIKGRLVKVSHEVKDRKKKNGDPFTTNEVFLEFRVKGERAVVVFPRKTSTTENLIAKLSNLDYSNGALDGVHIKIGNIQSEDGKLYSYISVAQNGEKVQPIIGYQKEGKEYPDDYTAIPQRQYMTEDGTMTTDREKAANDETNPKYKMTHPKWKSDVYKVYQGALENIVIPKVDEYNKNNEIVEEYPEGEVFSDEEDYSIDE